MPKSDDKSTNQPPEDGFLQEVILELIQADDGSLKLRDTQNKEEPLVNIEFSDKIKDMLGDDMKSIGHHMIHSAMQVIMQKQISNWHANVFDEEPEHYS